MSEWKIALAEHCKKHDTFTRNDFLTIFAREEDQKEFLRLVEASGDKKLIEFAGGVSNEWQGFVPAVIQSETIQYGFINDLPPGLVTSVGADGDSIRHKFVWKNDGVQDYLEGQPFNEVFVEGAVQIDRFRKVGAKIVETYECKTDNLSTLAVNVQLTMNEFKARDQKHFTHELHKATSNAYPTKVTDKHGNPLRVNGEDVTWRDLFENAVDGAHPSDKFADIKTLRHAMLNRVRDAVRPNIAVINATTELSLSDDDKVNLAQIFGGDTTYFRTGQMPSVYGLQFVVIPDAQFGYFTDDTARDQFVTTNDIFLLTTNNGPTIQRYTREPMSSEAWRIQDGQMEALNMWERYNYGTIRYTNIGRISYTHTLATGSPGLLD